MRMWIAILQSSDYRFSSLGQLSSFSTSLGVVPTSPRDQMSVSTPLTKSTAVCLMSVYVITAFYKYIKALLEVYSSCSSSLGSNSLTIFCGQDSRVQASQ